MYVCQKFDVMASRCFANYGKVIRSIVHAETVLWSAQAQKGAQPGDASRAEMRNISDDSLEELRNMNDASQITSLARKASAAVLRAALARDGSAEKELSSFQKTLLKSLRDAGAVPTHAQVAAMVDAEKRADTWTYDQVVQAASTRLG